MSQLQKTKISEAIQQRKIRKAAGGAQIPYHYHWEDPLEKAYETMPEFFTTKERVGLVADQFLKGIAGLKGAKENQQAIHGFDPKNWGVVDSKNTDLTSLKSRLGTISDEDAVRELYRILGDQTFQFNPDTYNSIVYGASAPSQAAASRQAQSTGNDFLDKYAKDRNWTVESKDGKLYVTNPEARGYGEIFSNPSDANYGKGLFVGTDGQLHFGALEGKDALNPTLIGQQAYDAAINAAKQKALDAFTWHRYLPTDYNEILEGIKANSDKIQDGVLSTRIKQALNNSDLAFADLSHNYQGGDYVFGIGTGRGFRASEGSPFGYDWRDQLIVKYNPKTGEYSYSAFNPEEYYAKLISESGDQFQGLDKQTITNLNKIDKQNYRDVDLNSIAGQQSIMSILNDYKSSKSKEIAEKMGFTPEEIIVSIYRLWRQGKAKLTNPKWKKKLLDAVADIDSHLDEQQIKEHKEGGILKAKEGSRAFAKSQPTSEERKNDAEKAHLQQRAEQNDRTAEQQAAGEQKLSEEWTGADTARAIGVVLDLASAGTSFAPTFGTAASGVLSTVSTLTDLGADIADKSVSAKEVWTNLGINAGLTGAALLPGGASAKATKTLVKLAPKAVKFLRSGVIAWGGLQFAKEDVLNSWGKIVKGDFKNITREDYKNIANSLKLIVGGVRSGSFAVKSNRLRARGVDAGTQTFTTNKGNKVTLTDAEVSKIHNAAKVSKTGVKTAEAELKSILTGDRALKKGEYITAIRDRYSSGTGEWIGKVKKPISGERTINPETAWDAWLLENTDSPLLQHKNSFLRTDAQIANSINGNWGLLNHKRLRLPDLTITPRGRAIKDLEKTPAKKLGGELEKLQEYLNRK